MAARSVPSVSVRVDPTAGMRILWLTSSADTDGPGRALIALLNDWRGDDVVAVTALRGISEAFRRECPPSVDLGAVGMRGAVSPGALIRLVRRCRAFDPDVIHTQLSRADWIGRLIGHRLRVPVVSTIHNVHSLMYQAEFRPALAWLGLTLDRLTAPLARHFIAVSGGVERDLVASGVPPNRITVVQNAVALSQRAPLMPREETRRAWHAAPDDIVVGTVALFKTQKGLEYLVDAARTVIERHPAVRFVQIGDGPLEPAIRERIRAAGIADRFCLAGRAADAVSLLSGFDIFVLPSLWEGMPLALLEAMAAGLPVVGTRVAGIEEAIEDRRTGLLVPPKDAPAIARAILELARDRALRARLSANAAAEIRRRTPARAAGACRQVYAGARLERAGRPGGRQIRGGPQSL